MFVVWTLKISVRSWKAGWRKPNSLRSAETSGALWCPGMFRNVCQLILFQRQRRRKMHVNGAELEMAILNNRRPPVPPYRSSYLFIVFLPCCSFLHCNILIRESAFIQVFHFSFVHKIRRWNKHSFFHSCFGGWVLFFFYFLSYFFFGLNIIGGNLEGEVLLWRLLTQDEVWEDDDEC